MSNLLPPDFDAKKQQVRDAVEAFLTSGFRAYPDSDVRRAAEYSTLGGGHRWRPIVAVAAGEIFRDDALEIVLPGACGAELAHAASLILDDLPSMDDASFRRGKPAAHCVFPGWAVAMAPVFLVTMAYDISLKNDRVNSDKRVRAALDLCDAGQQMIAGQAMDVRQDSVDDDKKHLLQLYGMKSGALYAASARSGAILCDASQVEADKIYQAVMKLGLSYQFMDDIADVVASLEDVGKESGKDSDKTTAVDLFGVDGARKKAREFQGEGLKLITGFGSRADWLRQLIQEASWKTH